MLWPLSQAKGPGAAFIWVWIPESCHAWLYSVWVWGDVGPLIPHAVPGWKVEVSDSRPLSTVGLSFWLLFAYEFMASIGGCCNNPLMLQRCFLRILFYRSEVSDHKSFKVEWGFELEEPYGSRKREKGSVYFLYLWTMLTPHILFFLSMSSSLVSYLKWFLLSVILLIGYLCFLKIPWKNKIGSECNV